MVATHCTAQIKGEALNSAEAEALLREVKMTGEVSRIFSRVDALRFSLNTWPCCRVWVVTARSSELDAPVEPVLEFDQAAHHHEVGHVLLSAEPAEHSGEVGRRGD